MDDITLLSKIRPPSDNIDKLINSIYHFSESELFEYIKKYISKWIVSILDDYSNDYNVLKYTWTKICDQLQVSPKKIIIVNDIPLEHNKYSIIISICDTLTKHGYLIRSKDHIQACLGCNKGILTKNTHTYFKNRSNNIPSVWNSSCSSCLN